MQPAEESTGTSTTAGFWGLAALSRAEEFNSIPPLDLDTLRTARQRISEEIAALQRILGNLAPVHALPAEILLRCFEMLSEDWHIIRLSYNSVDRLGWVRVTHVCQRWRNIALSHSALWHKPSAHSSPQIFLEMLTRARSSPLTIELPVRSWQRPGVEDVVYDALISHHTTLQAVSIDTNRLTSGDAMHKLKMFLTLPAPILHSLKLSSSEFSDSPKNLFGGYFPHLRHISLDLESTDTWLQVPFKDLVSLEIGHKGQPLESFNPLLDMLVNYPSLESLSLRNVLPTHTAAAPHSRPVRLPRLHNMTINSSQDVSCSRLLDALEVGADMTLQLNHVQLTNDAGHGLILSISRHISRRHDPPHHVAIDTDMWQFCLWPQAVERPDDCMLSLSFVTHRPYEIPPTIVQDLLKHLVPADTRAVSLRGPAPRTSSAATALWRDGLSLLEKVEEASLRHPYVIQLLCSPITSGMQGAERVPWPLLSTITFDFRAAVKKFKLREDKVRKMLRSMLRKRMNMGYPVQELRLWGSDLKGSGLVEIRKLVPTLTLLDTTS